METQAFHCLKSVAINFARSTKPLPSVSETRPSTIAWHQWAASLPEHE